MGPGRERLGNGRVPVGSARSTVHAPLTSAAIHDDSYLQMCPFVCSSSILSVLLTHFVENTLMRPWGSNDSSRNMRTTLHLRHWPRAVAARYDSLLSSANRWSWVAADALNQACWQLSALSLSVLQPARFGDSQRHLSRGRKGHSSSYPAPISSER